MAGTLTGSACARRPSDVRGGRRCPPRGLQCALTGPLAARRVRVDGGRERSRGGAVLKDFKTFLLRGNVVDLAVGIVIGVAFGAVVTALVKDLLTPIVAAIIGKPDFSALKFTINNSTFLYGDFINALIAFVTIAAAVFFFVVRPMNALMARRKRVPDPESETT